MNLNFHTRVPLVGVLLFALSACASAPKPHTRVVLPATFNGVVLVADGARARPEVQAAGFANLDKRAPLSDQTRFQVGSISKFLTTLTVLRLVDAGTFSLDDPIGRWVPGLPDDTARNVTLRHLLSNTSGIPDGATAALKKDPSILNAKDSARVAGVRFGQGALKFRPGEGWDYAVINWILVRAAVETSTKMSFEAVVQRELIKPLGLVNTGIPMGAFPENDMDAGNYSAAAPTVSKPSLIPAFAAGTGSFYSSAADLRKVMVRVNSDGFLSKAARDALVNVHWRAEDYALGGRVRAIEGIATPVLWETGKIGNYATLLAYRRSSQRVVVILSNNGQPQSAIAELGEQLLSPP